MFEKSSVARLETQPLYATLVKATGQAPQWNFHKYIVDRTGTRIASCDARVSRGSASSSPQSSDCSRSNHDRPAR